MHQPEATVKRLDWKRIADKYLGPEYLFPFVLWMVVDRGELSGRGLLLVAALTVITVGIPKFIQHYLIKRGITSEAILRTRSGRRNVWVVGSMVTGVTLSLTALFLLHPDRGLVAFYVALLAMVLAAYPCMFWLKVSGHAMGSAASMAAAFVFVGSWAWVFVPLMLIICVSRVVLGAHTPAEVLVGAMIGILVPSVTFWVFL